MKKEAPDLADFVVDGRLQLEEAEAVLRERLEQIRINKRLLAEALHDLARHAHLLEQNRHNEVVHFVLSETKLYEKHNAGPVDEFIQALEIFAQQACVLLDAIKEGQRKC